MNEKRRRFIVEESKFYKEYRYQIVAMDLGHRCGYVLIPKNHPYYDIMNYDDLSMIDCHGGLTFSKECGKDDLYPEVGHWIGFDCGHHMDIPDPKILELLGNKALVEIFGRLPKREGSIRTTAYVRRECQSIIRQLREAEAKAGCCPFLL